MHNFEHFDQPKVESKLDIAFGIVATDMREVLDALRSNITCSSDILPPLTLFDQTGDLLDNSPWHLYNGAGKDNLVQDGDTMHLSIDPKAKHDKDPGILQHIDLPVDQNSADQQTADRAMTAGAPADQATASGKPADQITAAEEGQPLHVKFWARSDQGDTLNVDIMQNQSPFAPTLDEHVKLTPAWKEYDFDGVAPTDGTKLDLHFTTPGAVDIREVSVTPESAEQIGVSPHDLTPSGMDTNIDSYRKGELNINVVDQNGKPVPGADVYIAQTRQDFLFGTEVQGLNPNDHTPAQQAYQAALKDTFNFATVTPYWPQTAEKGQPDKNDFAQADQQIEWLKNKDMAVKVHPAFWPHWTPGSLPDNPDQALLIIDKHTREFVQHFSQFDNVRFIENNEVAAALTDPTDNGATNWVKEAGAPAALERETTVEQQAMAGDHGMNDTHNTKGVDSTPSSGSTAGAQSLDGTAGAHRLDGSDKGRSEIQIDYNDYKNNQQEIQMLDKLQQEGKLPDAIGIQMHMTQGNWPLDRVEQIIKELSKYGKPIYISEISVLSGEHREGDSKSQKDWVSTPEGEKEQADYVQKLYQVLYSNPSVEGITWWDLSDNGAWQHAPRGLLRQDMTDKPAFDVLQNLIKHDWETKEYEISNTSGNVDQRVFAGDYDITVTEADGKKAVRHVHLPEGGNTAVSIEINQ